MADKLPARGIEGIADGDLPPALAFFRQWADALYGPNPEAAPPYPFWEEMSADEALRQHLLLREMETPLSYETRSRRDRIVRELVENITT